MKKRRYRLICFSVLNLTSPLHLGSGRDDPFADQPILRDCRRLPFLPGNTLVGMLAEAPGFDRRWQDWLRPTDVVDDFRPSPLVMDDAYPLPTQQQRLLWPVELRSQVSLLRHTLIAKTDHHFSLEVLPVGVGFCFACRADFADEKQRQEFLEFLRAFLSGGSLGGKQNAGGGRWQADRLGYVLLDLQEPKDLKAWLTTWHGFDWQGDWKALSGLPQIKIDPVTGQTVADDWQMELKVKITGLHLSAGATGLPRKNQPDLYQAERLVLDGKGECQRQFVDYGSTIKGRLRTAMELLLRTYLLQRASLDPPKVLELIPPDPCPSEDDLQKAWPEVMNFFGHQQVKGKFRVEETPWEKGELSKGEDHIRLDEFTQQTVGTAKFEFAPLYDGQTTVTVKLPNSAPAWQKELIYNAGVLLSLNVLPWGGYASRGYLGAEITSPPTVTTLPRAGALKDLVEKLVKWLTIPSPGTDNKNLREQV